MVNMVCLQHRIAPTELHPMKFLQQNCGQSNCTHRTAPNVISPTELWLMELHPYGTAPIQDSTHGIAPIKDFYGFNILLESQG